MGSICIYDASVINSLDNLGLGYGVLKDAISCIVTEERNGMFELELEYPCSGIRADKLLIGNFITCMPNPYTNPQVFRIYSVSKQLDGTIKVDAQHISYELSNFIVKSVIVEDHALNPNTIWNTIMTEHSTSIPTYNLMPITFTFNSDLTISDSIPDYKDDYMDAYVLNGPKSLRNILLGDDNDSIINKYYGSSIFDPPEYEFNDLSINLWKSRGSDKNIVIRYGSNMTEFSQDESLENVYTHIYPFYYANSFSYEHSYDNDKEPEQLEEPNFTVDMGDYDGSPYATTRYLDTGIRDDAGNRLPFIRVLPLDVSSLYSGDYSVTFGMGDGYDIYPEYTADVRLPIGGGDVYISDGETLEWWLVKVFFNYSFDTGVTSVPTKCFYLSSKLNSHFTIKWSKIEPNITKDAYGLYWSARVDITYNNKSDTDPYKLEEGKTIAELDGAVSNHSDADKSIDIEDPINMKVGCLQIEKAAKRYLKENHLDTFTTSISVSRAENSDLNWQKLNEIKLCDIVTIVNERYNMSAKVKCIKTVYDVVKNIYTELDFSNETKNFVTGFAKSLSNQKQYYANLSALNQKMYYLLHK